MLETVNTYSHQVKMKRKYTSIGAGKIDHHLLASDAVKSKGIWVLIIVGQGHSSVMRHPNIKKKIR